MCKSSSMFRYTLELTQYNRARILRNLARKLSAKREKTPAFSTKTRDPCSDTPSN
nr:MAG TPA: hypothetical protein [Caudoviricetes sp.]